MHTELGHDDHAHHPHRNRHLLQKMEGYTDLLVVGLIILFGLAMLIGLVTASGRVTW